MSSVCGPDSEFTLLYAWALDAEGFKMPEGITEIETEGETEW